MDARSILSLIRTQRHDFLNHLQVIQGYLQLNKIPEATEYIRELVLEAGRLSEINRLCQAEAALALLAARDKAAKQGITVEYGIRTDLRASALTGEELGACFEDVLAPVIDALSPPRITDRRIKVDLTEEQGAYLCRIDFDPGNASELKETVKILHERLSPRQGGAEFTVRAGRGVISLRFPAG